MADTSTYPATLDGDLRALVPAGTTPSGFEDFAQLVADAVAKIETELGTNPSGAAATVAAAIASALTAAGTSYAGGTGISATDVEGALDELATEKLDTATAAATYAPLTTPVFIASGAFSLAAGSPDRQAVSGWAGAWLMDASTDEAVAADLLVLPPSWATFDIDFIWANNGAGAGNVSWFMYLSQIGEGDGLGAGLELGGVVTDTAGAAGEVVVTRYATGHAKSADAFQSVIVYRNGTNAADTLANEAGLVGVLFTPTSFV